MCLKVNNNITGTKSLVKFSSYFCRILWKQQAAGMTQQIFSLLELIVGEKTNSFEAQEEDLLVTSANPGEMEKSESVTGQFPGIKENSRSLVQIIQYIHDVWIVWSSLSMFYLKMTLNLQGVKWFSINKSWLEVKKYIYSTGFEKVSNKKITKSKNNKCRNLNNRWKSMSEFDLPLTKRI